MASVAVLDELRQADVRAELEPFLDRASLALVGAVGLGPNGSIREQAKIEARKHLAAITRGGMVNITPEAGMGKDDEMEVVDASV